MPFSGLGAGRGCLDEILIFSFFLRNEDGNELYMELMEETRFKTDHSQHGNDKKIYWEITPVPPKLILFVFICRKKKKEVFLLKLVFQSGRVSAV